MGPRSRLSPTMSIWFTFASRAPNSLGCLEAGLVPPEKRPFEEEAKTPFLNSGWNEPLEHHGLFYRVEWKHFINVYAKYHELFHIEPSMLKKEGFLQVHSSSLRSIWTNMTQTTPWATPPPPPQCVYKGLQVTNYTQAKGGTVRVT